MGISDFINIRDGAKKKTNPAEDILITPAINEIMYLNVLKCLFI